MSDDPPIGVLLTNLGTPDAPTAPAVRRYLREFLWDRRVVDAPRWLWWPVLNGIILRIRPARSAHAYQRIWDEDGSPLLTITRRQAQALSTELASRTEGRVIVAAAMRYGRPSLSEALDSMRSWGIERILAFPLYPQYSGSTSASTFDGIADVLRGWPWIPELRFINGYYQAQGYISALAASVRQHWERHGRNQRLLMSFHGIPERYAANGDPYPLHCYATAGLLAERLGLEAAEWGVVFQSRFGREEWLRPYMDKTLKALPAQGVKSVDVICPGFSADCLETLEEVAITNRELFLAAGGKGYQYVAGLNDREEHIRFLADFAERHLRGWLPGGP